MTGVVDGRGKNVSWPWRRALLWLAVLGPLFLLSCHSCNWATVQQAAEDVYFGWEQYIPFQLWAIVHCWTVGAFFVASLLICRSRHELDRHGLRLLTILIISVAFFLLFLLHFAFQRLWESGLYDALFHAFAISNTPFGQTPSLHVALLVILWTRYAAHLSDAYPSRRWTIIESHHR